MPTLELFPVAGVFFLWVCVLFVFREVRDTPARKLSRVRTGKRWGRGEEKNFLLPPPSSVSRLTSLFTER